MHNPLLSYIFVFVKFIAIIMALFLFSGSLSACGLSDLCCQDTLEVVMDCCKKTSNDKPADGGQENSSCCEQGISYVQEVLIAPTEGKIELLPSTLVVLPFIFNHSFDFHNAVWQPPKAT